MGHTWENGSPLEKWVTLGKNGGTCKNGKIWKTDHTSKNGSHLQKWVTVVNIFHTKKVFYTWKDGSDLQQGVIIRKK